MASDGKSYNGKVLHLVETDDFDINIVLICGRMQMLQENSGLQQYLAGSSGAGSGPSGRRPDE